MASAAGEVHTAPASPAPRYTEPPHRPFQYCREQSQAYEKLGSQVGKGQFGAVFKARCRETKTLVALKKILMAGEAEGFPLTALREIKITSLLKDINTLKLLEVVHSAATDYNHQKGDIYLVFEFMDYDLGGLLNKGVEFTLPEIKCLSKQLFSGLHYLQVNNILHRDLKVANLLLNRHGILKIADFGLARNTDKTGRYTHRVCTRWYRAPELLLGLRFYSFAIDMWSAGCIVAEFFTGSPILQGGVGDARTEKDHDIDQFHEICKLCGSPNLSTWQQSDDQLPDTPIMMPKAQYPRTLREFCQRSFKLRCDEAVALVDEILVLDPSKRLTAAKALDHSFFWSKPAPCAPGEMRNFGSDCHDYTTPVSRRRDLKPPRRYAYAQEGGAPREGGAEVAVEQPRAPREAPEERYETAGNGHGAVPTAAASGHRASAASHSHRSHATATGAQPRPHHPLASSSTVRSSSSGATAIPVTAIPTPAAAHPANRQPHMSTTGNKPTRPTTLLHQPYRPGQSNGLIFQHSQAPQQATSALGPPAAAAQRAVPHQAHPHSHQQPHPQHHSQPVRAIPSSHPPPHQHPHQQHPSQPHQHHGGYQPHQPSHQQSHQQQQQRGPPPAAVPPGAAGAVSHPSRSHGDGRGPDAGQLAKRPKV